MSGHIVMVTRGVMCDVGQSVPAGAERRGFPPRQRSLVAGGAAAVWSQLRLGTLDEKYYMKYMSNTVDYRICVITLSKG